MESHAVKNVIVQIHHVIMSMDALAYRVSTKTFNFEIECVFQNKQTNKQKLNQSLSLCTCKLFSL